MPVAAALGHLEDVIALEAIDHEIAVEIGALGLLALRQALEQPNAVTLGVQAIDVIENDRRVEMFPELAVKAEDGKVAFQPADWPASAWRTIRLLPRPWPPIKMRRFRWPRAKA
jgi:hypothetical protein